MQGVYFHFLSSGKCEQIIYNKMHLCYLLQMYDSSGLIHLFRCNTVVRNLSFQAYLEIVVTH